MTLMLNTADYVDLTSKVMADAFALRKKRDYNPMNLLTKEMEEKLAELEDQHKKWLAATYMPNMSVEGTDALYLLAMRLYTRGYGDDGMVEEFYIEVVDAFKLALKNVV